MTLRYVYGQDEIIARFVAEVVGGMPFETCKAIGVIDDEGTLIAGVVYHHWNPAAGVIHMSAASLPGANWLTRETLSRMYEYPFDQCGCQMVLKTIPADREELLSLLAHGGYMFVAVPRLFGRDRDGVICLFTAEVWAKSRFNKNRKRVERHPLDIPEFLDRRQQKEAA